MGSRVAISALLVAATLLAYAGVRQHRFVDLDDRSMIVENPDLRVGSLGEALRAAFTSRAMVNWTPLAVLSLQLGRALHGGAPGPTLLANVGLHAAAAVLLFLALAELTGRRGPSAFVAGVFALHPLHVESVAWAAQREDVLSGLFFMAALWLHARHARRPSFGRIGAVWVCVVLALLAKPIAVTLPFVLLLLDGWPLRRLGDPAMRRRAILEKLPMLLPVVAVSLVTLRLQTPLGLEQLPLGLRVANAIDAYAVYAAQSFWPVGLAVFYPHPMEGLPAWRVGLAGLGLGVVSAAAIALRRRQPAVLVGWLWYLGTLVPVIGLVQVGVQAHADRYTYLPLVGLAIAVAFPAADLLGRGRAGRLALVAAGLAALAAAGAATAAQLEHWRDAVALHARVVALHPENPRARHRLANALRDAGRLEEALEHYEQVLANTPRYALGWSDRAGALARLGRIDEALESYERSVELDPADPLGRANLGLLLARQGRDAEARRHLERALAASAAVSLPADASAPRLATLHVALADLLVRQGEPQAAFAHYERAVAIDASQARAAANLGAVLVEESRYAEAAPLLERALQQLGQSPQVHANLGRVHAALGRPARAVAHLRRALELQPGSRSAVAELAFVLATSADPAVRDPAEALRLVESVPAGPSHRARLLDARAAALAAAGRYEEAVVACDRALALPANPRRAAAIRARRDLYRRGRPFVEGADGTTDRG